MKSVKVLTSPRTASPLTTTNSISVVSLPSGTFGCPLFFGDLDSGDFFRLTAGSRFPGRSSAPRARNGLVNTRIEMAELLDQRQQGAEVIGACLLQPLEKHHFGRDHVDAASLHPRDGGAAVFRGARAGGIGHEKDLKAHGL